MLTITNDAGRPFNVITIRTGERYGRTNALTADEPMVSIYDASQDKDVFGDRGQFVSRYYLSTLADGAVDKGVHLDGGVPVWHISATNKAEVIAYAVTEILQTEGA
jgi:hypothetical protein